MFQKEIVDGDCLYVCYICNEGFDHLEEVQKPIIKIHQNVFLELRKDCDEDEERDIVECMKKSTKMEKE